MTQLFETLQHFFKDQKVETFIHYFDDRRIFQYADFFLLDQARIKRLLQQNIAALASDITVTAADLADKHVVAMTIDGDFILASDSETLVLPRTLVKADLETFDVPVLTFFIQYETGQLPSNILPDVPQMATTSETSEASTSEAADSPEAEPKKRSFFQRLFDR